MSFIVVLLLLLSSFVDAQKDKTKNEDILAEPDAALLDEEEDIITKPPLTGNPQIDYLLDPNLPHELNGYDLSDYPFYNRPPKEGHNFTCDNRLDGFYASVPHKCQV